MGEGARDLKGKGRGRETMMDRRIGRIFGVLYWTETIGVVAYNSRKKKKIKDST